MTNGFGKNSLKVISDESTCCYVLTAAIQSSQDMTP